MSLGDILRRAGFSRSQAAVFDPAPVRLAFPAITATTVDHSTNSPVASAVITLPALGGIDDIGGLDHVKLRISGTDTAAVNVELVGPDGATALVYDYGGNWDYPVDDYDAQSAATTVELTVSPEGPDGPVYVGNGLPDPAKVYLLPGPAGPPPLVGAKLSGEWELRVTAYGNNDAPVGPMTATVTAEAFLAPAQPAMRPDLAWLPGEESRGLTDLLHAGITTNFAPTIHRSERRENGRLVWANGIIVKPAGVAMPGTHNLIDDITNGGEFTGWSPSSNAAFYVPGTNVTDGYANIQLALHIGPVEWKATLADGTVLPTAKEIWIPLVGRSWPGLY